MHDLPALLGPTGTCSTAALRAAVDASTVSRWITSGRLVRLHPGWVTLAQLADDWHTRAHAAVGYSGGALSHMSALAVHGVVDDHLTRLDVTVPMGRRVRTSRWLRVHRTARDCTVVEVAGLPVTALARAVVDTWGDAHRSGAPRRYRNTARAAVLRATRDRRVRPRELDEELAGRSELPGREHFVEMLGLIRAGCQSELEILGLQSVLDVPGLPRPQLQYRVALADGLVRLDAAWPELKVAVEFDGMAFHSSRQSRERDLRRDAALAALGWVVLRFSYRDVADRPERCRAQVAATCRNRLTDVPPRGIPRQECHVTGQ